MPTDIPADELLWIREQLAEDGTELTPSQVRATAESAFDKLRNFLRAKGVPEDKIPDSDDELRRLVWRS